MRLPRLAILLLCFCSIHASNYEQVRKHPKFRTLKKIGHKILEIVRSGELPKIPALPKIIDTKAMAVVPRETKYDPCKTGTPCQNGGTCTNKEGVFFCICPATWYGKACHLKVDDTHCGKNQCKNGGVCYSTDGRHMTIVDEVQMAEIIKRKTVDELTTADYIKILVDVHYECWCADGFSGPLCEYSADQLRCEEDYCRGHGRAVVLPDGGCLCTCEPGYAGERCDLLLPCHDWICYNHAVCQNVEKKDAKGVLYAYEAVCVCPKTEQIKLLDGITVTGDNCEMITVPDMTDAVMQAVPCSAGATPYAWKKGIDVAIETKYTWLERRNPWFEGKDWTKTASKHIQTCMLRDDTVGGGMRTPQACTEASTFTGTSCLGGGACEMRLLKTTDAKDEEPEKYILAPHCACNDMDEGAFCEWTRKDLCDPSKEEWQRGVDRDNRCANGGTCKDNGETAECICPVGWSGATCEDHDPCGGNECGEHAKCIPLPAEAGHPATYRCLCDMDQKMANATRCVYDGEGGCAGRNPCTHGACINCQEGSTNLAVCGKDEAEQGFRCICPTGTLPPFCDHPSTPCTDNKCRNGANCTINGYDYTCKCSKGSIGTYCEFITDICQFEGKDSCGAHGQCVDDTSHRRGFHCVCDGGFAGRDCELELDAWTQIVQFVEDNYSWSYAVITWVLCGALLGVAYLLCARSTKSARELEKQHASKPKQDKAKPAIAASSNEPTTPVAATPVKPTTPVASTPKPTVPATPKTAATPVATTPKPVV